MSKEQEVKQILLNIRQYLCNTEFAPPPFTRPVDSKVFPSGFAKDICSLFEPDESLLLSDEAKYGGFYLCGNCQRPVRNYEECHNCKPDEPQTYHLNCIKCGNPFWIAEAFPSPLLCPNCRAEPDESLLIGDEEIGENFKQKTDDDETYEEYASQLGIHFQDAINIARHGAIIQLTHCAPLIRAEERAKVLKEVFEAIGKPLQKCVEELKKGEQ